jgi:hypothetical protein
MLLNVALHAAHCIEQPHKWHQCSKFAPSAYLLTDSTSILSMAKSRKLSRTVVYAERVNRGQIHDSDNTAVDHGSTIHHGTRVSTRGRSRPLTETRERAPCNTAVHTAYEHRP